MTHSLFENVPQGIISWMKGIQYIL